MSSKIYSGSVSVVYPQGFSSSSKASNNGECEQGSQQTFVAAEIHGGSGSRLMADTLERASLWKQLGSVFIYDSSIFNDVKLSIEVVFEMSLAVKFWPLLE